MNKTIVASALFIGGVSVFKAFSNKKPITRIIIGSFLYLLILSLIDFFGGYASQIASALAMLAVVVVAITEVPWDTIIKLANLKGSQ